ncbi:MAG: DUF885 domain-containing protein [Chitinophagaceae bacterium]|nr:DUF885 domain-containing protein [Oligoflexus sp.]
MKKIVEWLFFIMFAAVIVVAGNFWFFRPFTINEFYTRCFVQIALEKPQLLSTLHFIEQYGIKFHQSKLDDLSEAAQDETLAALKRMMKQLKEYDTSHFNEDEKNNYDTFEHFLADQIEGHDKWRYHNYPLNQLFGLQSEFPSFMDSSHQVKTEGDADDYVTRLTAVKAQFRQIMEGLVIRESKGIIPPRFVILKVLAEMNAFVKTPPEQNILYRSFEKKLKESAIVEADQHKVLARAKDEIIKTVYPSYQMFIDYFEILKGKATDDDGVWKLPEGDAYYAYALKSETTTDLSPEAIHQIGLREVERIEAEMKKIFVQQGLISTKTVGQMMEDLGRDQKVLYPDTDAGRAQILLDYKTILDESEAKMSDLFDQKPKAKIQVKRIPEFKEKTSPGGYYEEPAMDGTRPGTFYANLYDIKATPKFGMRSLAHHEGIPGHHFQISLAQENPNLVFFRKIIPFTAYVEGWALYAEQLGFEAGLDSDPFNNLGRLQSELFRSVRLVVDTGIHRKHWTRIQAIRYMIDHTGMAESDVVSEIERYIVNPGQACAYKVGMLKILALRQRARDSLGDRFNLKEFHSIILGGGALPLSLVERNVDAWIKRKKV